MVCDLYALKKNKYKENKVFLNFFLGLTIIFSFWTFLKCPICKRGH